MGKYDNILICSDFDETFAWQGQVPKENMVGLEAFYKEGGLFTFCTGRSPENMKNSVYKRMTCFPNAPLICHTGAYARREDGSFLINKSIQGDWQNIVREICKTKNLERIDIVCENDEHFSFNAYNKEEMERAFRDAENKPIYKILFHHPISKRMIPYGIKKIVGNKLHLFANAVDMFELNAKGANKGKGTLALKKDLGAKVLICLGDYDGDIDMLKSADISICPENANEKVKPYANYILCHAEKGLLLDVVNHLDKILAERNIK